jgi:UDP-N-acetylglucosamine--N-acetylmuramyl-(pentapeptide) pyrophosphoryl-undecaprenol N-acetylglucosamine transferase
MNVIIAGGGTGGHLFPGIAIAEEILRRDRNNRVLFVGTKRGIEHRILPGLGYELSLIDVAGIKGKGLTGTLAAVTKLPRSFLQSGRIIRSFRPDLVLGVGGYASGPAVLMAHLLGIPTAVAEQNAFPGVTNRILSRFVDRIFLTFPDTEGRFPKSKSLYTGNPIRAAFLSELAAPERKKPGFTLLIFGGSQGARAINRAVPAALDQMTEIKGDLHIIHQTGTGDFEEVGRAYRAKDFDAEVHAFIMDMPRVYGQADLLVCRAGATSIAELTASGRASLLIPYPYAANDHQSRNAEVLVRAGAAVMIPESDLTADRLGSIIMDLYHHRDRIQEMEARSRALAKPEAAGQIFEECVSLIAKKGRA